MTHVVRPALAQPRAPPSSHALATPETSDLSAASASDTEHGQSDVPTEVADHTESETESVSEGDTTFHTAQDISFTSLSERFGVEEDSEEGEDNSLSARLGELGLHRTASHGSSAYASSEGGFSEASGIGKQWQLDSPVTGTFNLPSASKNSVPRRTDDVLDKPTFFEYLFGE